MSLAVSSRNYQLINGNSNQWQSMPGTLLSSWQIVWKRLLMTCHMILGPWWILSLRELIVIFLCSSHDWNRTLERIVLQYQKMSRTSHIKQWFTSRSIIDTISELSRQLEAYVNQCIVRPRGRSAMRAPYLHILQFLISLESRAAQHTGQIIATDTNKRVTDLQGQIRSLALPPNSAEDHYASHVRDNHRYRTNSTFLMVKSQLRFFTREEIYIVDTLTSRNTRSDDGFRITVYTHEAELHDRRKVIVKRFEADHALAARKVSSSFRVTTMSIVDDYSSFSKQRSSELVDRGELTPSPLAFRWTWMYVVRNHLTLQAFGRSLNNSDNCIVYHYPRISKQVPVSQIMRDTSLSETRQLLLWLQLVRCVILM